MSAVGKRPTTHVPLPPEDVAQGERSMGLAWLAYLRESAIYKAEGLTDEQLRWSPTPSALSIGQLVCHLALAERQWVRAIGANQPMDLSWRAQMFTLPDGWSADDAIAFYRAETALTDAVLEIVDLDAPSANPDRPSTWRWILVHLIEEVARHCGHLDLTRELLDGKVGR